MISYSWAFFIQYQNQPTNQPTTTTTKRQNYGNMKVIFSSSLNSIFLSCLLLLLLRTWLCQRGSIWRCHEETMKLIEVGVGCGSNQSERTLSHPPPSSNAFGTIKLHSPEGWNSFVILLKNSVSLRFAFFCCCCFFPPEENGSVFISQKCSSAELCLFSLCSLLTTFLSSFRYWHIIYKCILSKKNLYICSFYQSFLLHFISFYF